MREISEPEAVSEVATAFGITTESLRDIRKKSKRAGNEEAQQARDDVVGIFKSYRDPVRAVRWWLAAGPKP
jgi:hypothetical protein